VGQLTCVYCRTDTNPEETEYVGPETLTRLFRIIVWERHCADLGVGRPVIHETCRLADHVGPFTILHLACLVALNELLETAHHRLVEGIILPMLINHGLQDLD
jgi:hypothetical protein